MSHEAVEFSRWIERADWVRGLSRALVADEHEAEDLAQEAWLAALTGGTPRQGASEGWFVGVLRNLARAQFRGAKRRQAREREVARHEHVPSDDPIERLEIHERLVAAVRALEEPYRSAIVLRYLEGLSPSAVALRTHAPLRTVHTRLQRGLQRLRERLDRDHRGGRREWLAALAPLTFRFDAPLVGAMLVKLKGSLIAALLLLFVLATVTVLIRRASPEPSLSVANAASTESAAENSIVAMTGRSEREETPVALAPTAEVSVAPSKAIHGIVIGVDDRPIARVRVAFIADHNAPSLTIPEAVSDERGEFALPDNGLNGVLRPIGDQLIAVLEPRVAEYDVEQHYALVVAPIEPIAGVVIDETGKPLSAARVQFRPPRDLRARLQRVVDRSATVSWEAVSDAEGRFRIANAPRLARATLETDHFDCGANQRALPDNERDSVQIVLHHLASSAGRCEGFVVDPDGKPIAGAYLFLGRGSATSDELGHFKFRVDESAPWEHLRAFKRGYELLEIAPRTADASDPSAFPRPIRIELARAKEPLRIEGVVFDENGHPLAGATVKRLDGRAIGTRGYESVELESLSAGEERNAGTKTDERGHFVVDGLTDSEYSLRVLDRRTMRAHETEPIHAGARDVRIDMPPEPSYARVAGRVVDTDGIPIPRAEVFLYRIVQDFVHDHDRKEKNYIEGERVRCDAAGSFEFRDVTKSVAMLSASTPGANRITNVDLAKQSDVEHLELIVPRAAHVQIDWSASSLDVTLAGFVDANGITVWSTTFDGAKSWSVMAPIDLIDRRSEAVAVPLNATEVVLCNVVDHHVEELLHIPLHLKAGELTIVRP